MNMIEKVARAIAGPGASSPWLNISEEKRVWEMYTRDASAAIEAHKAALADAGLVIMPREPTEAMLNAAWDTDRQDIGEEGNTLMPQPIWQAMIDAALSNSSDAE